MAKKKVKPIPLVFGKDIEKLEIDGNWKTLEYYAGEVPDPTTLLKAIKTDRLNRAMIIVMDNLTSLNSVYACKLVSDHWKLWRKLYG